MKIYTFGYGSIEGLLLLIFAILAAAIARVYFTTDATREDGTKKGFKERLDESSVPGLALAILTAIALFVILSLIIYITVFLATYNANPYNR